MTPIDIQCSASGCLKALKIFAYGSLAVVLWRDFEGARLWLLAFFMLAAFAFEHMGSRQPIRRLYISASGEAFIDNGVMRQAQLLPTSVCSRFGVVAHWHTPVGVFRQLMLPDVTDAATWRALRVWMRWQAPLFSTSQHDFHESNSCTQP